MKIRTIAVTAIAALAVQGASAHGGDGLWYISSVGLCMAQDASYASLPAPRMFAQDESIPRFIAELPPDFKKCLVARKAKSATFCKMLLTIDPNPGPSNEELDKFALKYRKDIDTLHAVKCAAIK